jgi:hypothetical protein
MNNKKGSSYELPFCIYFLTTATTFSALFTFISRLVISGGTKFSCGKCHASEYCARIVVLGRNTFLFGNTIFGCMDKVLSGSDYANNREESERYGYISSFSIRQTSIHSSRNRLWDIVAAATATTIVFGLAYLCIKDYRINNLYYSNGQLL